MRPIDFIPDVLEALKEPGKEMTGTDLSEVIWGTSGRGNPNLTQKLFPYMVQKGLLKVRTKGRAKYYSLSSSYDQILERLTARGTGAAGPAYRRYL